jgi:hypothetical protein
MKKSGDFLIQWKWNGIKLVDILLVIVLVSTMMIMINKSALARQTQTYMKPVTIELVVPNLDPVVAEQIRVSDIISDQKGRACFEILEKIERSAEHPTIDAKGQIVVAQHPKLVSLFLTIRSVDAIEFNHGIKYNWQVIKTGGSLIWETRFCRFVGLVRKIS